MNEGFQKMTISDPNKLGTFLEGTTGSILAILNVIFLTTKYKYNLLLKSLNGVLYTNDPSQIPITDFEAAASLPYDTDIPEGAEINYK